MSDLKEKELTMKVKKAEAAIAELEFKIAERHRDIGRMEEHIELQKANIAKAGAELNELK